jgi:threonyl-tRNA synthetase
MQAVVLPISERQLAYAKEVGQKLKNAGLRVEVDERSEKIGYKIREAQLKKVPYMLVVGDKEAEAQAVSVRERSGDDKGAMPVMQFIEKALDEVSRRIQ